MGGLDIGREDLKGARAVAARLPQERKGVGVRAPEAARQTLARVFALQQEIVEKGRDGVARKNAFGFVSERERKRKRYGPTALSPVSVEFNEVGGTLGMMPEADACAVDPKRQ